MIKINGIAHIQGLFYVKMLASATKRMALKVISRAVIKVLATSSERQVKSTEDFMGEMSNTAAKIYYTRLYCSIFRFPTVSWYF